MLNSVNLTGRLTKDIDLRYTSNGSAVGNFNLAVDRSFKNASGERETDFIQCVVWRKAAETMAEYTRKGSLIGITGRIQTRNYENKEGQRVYITEVNVEQFTFLDTKNSNQKAIQNNTLEERAEEKTKEKDNQDVTEDPFEKNSDVVDISDSDLPF